MCCLFPKSTATEELRSFRTSNCRHSPDLHQRLARRATSPLSSFWRRKFLQLYFTVFAINSPVILGPVPKATATFANLQLHAQFHDRFSIKASSPVSSVLFFS